MADDNPKKEDKSQSGRDLFDASESGAQGRPWIPRLRSDSPTHTQSAPLSRSLAEFREAEGREHRKRRLRELWRRLPQYGLRHDAAAKPGQVVVVDYVGLTPEKADELQTTYEAELLRRCGGYSSGSPSGNVGWKAFVQYAEAKEEELWSIFHDELDLDGNGHLDAQELSLGLSKAGACSSPHWCR